MKTIETAVRVPGGEGKLTLYLRDNLDMERYAVRPMVLVIPGGAYAFCSDREADPVALSFLAQGCHAAVLRYSCAPDAVFPTALQELAESVALIREKAEAWHVDPGRIYLCGFSAGGHLALSLGVFWNNEKFREVLPPAEKIRPNGLILAYPVVTSGTFAHRGSIENLLGKDREKEELLTLVSLEKQVSADVPPCFLWTTDGDRDVPAENSLLLALSLRANGVPVELHMFRRGGHGLSLGTKEMNEKTETGDVAFPEIQAWLPLALTWLNVDGKTKEEDRDHQGL